MKQRRHIMIQIRGAHKGYTVIVDVDGSMKIYNKSKECVKYIPPAESGLAFFDVDTIKDAVEKYLEEEAKKRLSGQSSTYGLARKFQAKFIGEKASYGFEPGKIYTLRSSITTVVPVCNLFMTPEMCIVVYDVNCVRNSCPYSSIESFIHNWEIQYPVDTSAKVK